MKTLTIEQVETLKNVCWEKENETSFSFIPDVKTFTELTDYDVKVWTEDTQSTELSIKYQTTNITENDIPYFALRFIAKIHGIIWADEYFVMFKGDELGLFTPKTEEQEEQTTEENPIELLKKALELCAEKEVATSDITSVIEDYDYLYDAIKENIIDNLGVEDLSDSLMEDAANEYIERCPADCYERAMDNMDSYEIKDKIIDYLSDNL